MPEQVIQRRDAAACLSLFLLALVPRAAVIAICLHFSGEMWFWLHPGDAAEYAALAANIADGLPYNFGGGWYLYAALQRPPGYPLFLAVFRILGCFPAGPLIVQALLGSLIPCAVYETVRRLAGRRFPALLAGLASALSPTGIGCAGLLMTDLPLCVMLIAGLALLWAGAAGGKQKLAAAAGVVFAAGMLVKPILLFMAPLSAAFYLMFCRARRQAPVWRAVWIMMAVQAAAWAGWTAHNKAAYDVWTFSIVGAQNLRYHVVPYVEVSAANGRLVPADWAARIPRNVRKYNVSAMQRGILTVQDHYRDNKKLARRVLNQFPLLTLMVLARNSLDFLGGWQLFAYQLAGADAFRHWMMVYAICVEPVHWIVIFGMLLSIAAVCFPLPGRGASAAEQRAAAAALLTMILYFFALNSTSNGEGARLMFPVEFAALILAAMGWDWLVRRLPGWLKRVSPERPKPSA